MPRSNARDVERGSGTWIIPTEKNRRFGIDRVIEALRHSIERCSGYGSSSFDPLRAEQPYGRSGIMRCRREWDQGMTSNGKPLLSLEPGEVDVWLTALSDIGDDLREDYTRLLSAAECAKWRGFLVEGPRLQYLVSKALLRTALSRYAYVAEDAWEFEANSHGRPYVSRPAHCRGLQFSLSHTDGLVACAIAKGCEIGVDVENTRREFDFLAVARSVFSPFEVAAMERCAPESLPGLFYSVWTLKEAYVKARGLGLSLALDGFWFELEGATPRVHFSERCVDDPDHWHFRQFDPTSEHRLALAVSTVAKKLDMRPKWTIPLAKTVDAE